MLPLDTGIVRLLAAGLVAVALSGCSNPVEQHGNLPSEGIVAQIKPGSTDKETVTRLLGSPSSVASFDDNTWYYISHKTKDIAFFKPETTDQQVVSITFNKDGVVTGVQKLGLSARNDVNPVERTTPAPGKELTFFEQLIGNFGRFNSDSNSSSSSSSHP